MAPVRRLLVLLVAASAAACGVQPPAAPRGEPVRRVETRPRPPAPVPAVPRDDRPRAGQTPQPGRAVVAPAIPVPAGSPAAPGRREAAVPAAAPRPVRRLGLLFPEQGPRRGLGLEARRGAELCLEDPGAARGFRFEAVAHDESEAQEPGALVADLAAGGGIVALVGPLLSETAQKLLAAAEERALPVISPTAAAGRLGEGSRVFFRTCLTMESYATALAGFAAGRLEGATFATLAPAERYGRSLAAAFGPALEQRGGRVVLAREYVPGLRELVPWAAGLARELRRPGAQEEGAWGVDALFLAGSAQDAGMILPRLAHLGLDPRAIAVVGTSALNVPEFPRLAGGFAEGVLLADGYFAASEQPSARAFARRYRERHGTAPGAAAAQACAAVEIVAAALAAGASTPAETLAALVALGEVPTVLGPVRVLAGGKVERRPFYITVRGGKLVELEAD